MSRILFIGPVWKTHDAPCHGRKRFRMDRRKSVTRTPRVCGWVMGGWLKGSELRGFFWRQNSTAESSDFIILLCISCLKQHTWTSWHCLLLLLLFEDTRVRGTRGVRGARGLGGSGVRGEASPTARRLFDIILKTVCHTSVLCTKCVSHFSKSNCE